MDMTIGNRKVTKILKITLTYFNACLFPKMVYLKWLISNGVCSRSKVLQIVKGSNDLQNNIFVVESQKMVLNGSSQLAVVSVNKSEVECPVLFQCR